MSSIMKIPEPLAERTILIVDDDRVSSRYLEVALSRIGNYRIEVAINAASALEILSSTIVDLILSDIMMPDVDGYQFLQRIQRENRYRSIPFMFISSDGRVASKVGGLQMGVDDYITKPFEVTELRARIENIFRRDQKYKTSLHNRRYVLAGDFTGLTIPDLINILEQGARSGVVNVVTKRARAELIFEDGRILQATYGNVEGETAFFALLMEKAGSFEFTPGKPDHEFQRTITRSCTALLMEGARRQDTALQNSNDAAVSSLALQTIASRLTELVDFSTIVEISVQLESAVETVLNDPFSLAELDFFTLNRLREWTRHDGPGERLHILLLASVNEIAPMFTALAAPLPEQQIIHAFNGGIACLGLVFHLSNDRIFDVLLIDRESPAELLDGLRRKPSAVIVAPPHGDILSLTLKARSEMEVLLQRLQPPAVLGLGNAALEPSLRSVLTHAHCESELRCVSANLSDNGADLREHLLDALHIAVEASRASEIRRAEEA